MSLSEIRLVSLLAGILLLSDLCSLETAFLFTESAPALSLANLFCDFGSILRSCAGDGIVRFLLFDLRPTADVVESSSFAISEEDGPSSFRYTVEGGGLEDGTPTSNLREIFGVLCLHEF